MPTRVLGGRYKVLDKIGIGGMATVYRGMDEVLNRSVAIKLMLPQYANDPSFAARFKQEAQAAAALQSPYIVGIFDWGQDGDTYYIVMELLRGTDLKTGLKNHGALEPRKVAQIGSQICQALTVAHNHGIIHRDIKPQNIMVQPDGNIKVMDFGIARASNSHLTATNSVLGTAHYVSPEQTQGKDLGATSDIYSLGIVMYEAATGQVPFDGDDAISVALKQVNEQPVPPSKINPRVDPSLEAIILKCMAKDPAQRFQTAEELRRALMDYLAGRVVNIENGSATAPVPAVTRRNPTVTATQRMNRVQEPTRIAAGTPTPAPAPAPESKGGPKKGLIIGIVVAAIAILAIVIWMVMSSSGATQAVPNYVSLTRAQAEEEIRDSDFFTLGPVREEYSDTVERGVVMSQDPASGTQAKRGTAITLTVSQGKAPAEEVEVPDLRNLTPDQAAQALSAAHLVGEVGDSVADDDIDVGRVATQSPAAHTKAKAGDTVTYHLSKGPDSVDVPNVLGYSEAEAVDALEGAGFGVNVLEDYSSTTAAGYVMRYSPQGSQAKGATITITVSLGAQNVSVPDVTGMSQAQATQALQDEGFSVSASTVESDEAAGTVVGYSPTGEQAPGTTITIQVSSGPTTSGGGTQGGTTQSQ